MRVNLSSVLTPRIAGLALLLTALFGCNSTGPARSTEVSATDPPTAYTLEITAASPPSSVETGKEKGVTLATPCGRIVVWPKSKVEYRIVSTGRRCEITVVRGKARWDDWMIEEGKKLGAAFTEDGAKLN